MGQAKNYIWLSYPLNPHTPTYGNSQGIQVKPDKSIANGDSCNTASWYFPGNHLGTHVDAPRHFFEQGSPVDAFDASFWVFNQICLVETKLLESVKIIEPEHISSLIKGDPDLLLIRTGLCHKRGSREYWENNIGLSPTLGKVLKQNFPALRAVGIDSISISSWQNRELGREAHRSFLDPEDRQPLVLIEDMDLTMLTPSSRVNKVTLLPLRVQGADGAPCTILAEVEQIEK